MNDQQNQNEQASIDAKKEKIGFGVDKLGSDIEKNNIESNEEEQIDPTQNIKPLPQTDEMPEMEPEMDPNSGEQPPEQSNGYPEAPPEQV